MRDVYRGLAVVAAVAVVAVGLFLVLPSRSDEAAVRPVAAPSAVPASSAPARPTASPSASASASASAQPSVRPTPTPGTSLAPGYTAMEALYADARLPRLPEKVTPGFQPGRPKRVIEDRRAGIAVPRMGKPWKTYGAAPFTSRQVLPTPRGAKTRGMLVTCPVPIDAQKDPRDTALLAARWTLNHHPKGATLRWLSSQPVKGGWALVFRVVYGKHSSKAAVVVVDGGMAKPALAFVTVPDTQRNRWRDIERIASGARVLG